MEWFRKPKSDLVETGHFVDDEPCVVCHEESDAVVVNRDGSQDYYCRYCIIIITAEWSMRED